MSVVDEVEAAATDSFWEVDQFRRTVKRVDDGLHMCQELSRMIAERAEIEHDYAKKLQAWSKKWNETIEKGPEYGTNKAILLGSLNEAESLADVHNSVRDKLAEVQTDVKKWKHDTFKKQMVGGCKEAKAFEDEFRKAQKPWAKKLAKVQKCRKDYHTACKLEKSAITQLSTESTSNPDQAKKLQDRVEKCRKDVENTKDKYEEALAVLHKYNSAYVDDMTEVFVKTQEFEEKRLRFFKDVLVGVHGCLDISRSNELPRIYDQLRQTINMSDASKDLRWWSQNHGVEMPMLWPTFEEFSTDPSTVSRKEKPRNTVVTFSDTNIHIASAGDRNGAVAKVPSTQVVTRDVPVGQVPAATRATVSEPPPLVQRKDSYDVRLNPFGDDDNDEDSTESDVQPAVSSDSAASTAPSTDTAAAASVTESAASSSHAPLPPTKTPENTAAGANPFDEDDDDDEEDFSNVVGVRVEALYDYLGQEQDELSFKKGEHFEKLQDRDDQGWCTGRKDGRVGLYPDNYAKLLNH